jgi:hypothetical protein
MGSQMIASQMTNLCSKIKLRRMKLKQRILNLRKLRMMKLKQKILNLRKIAVPISSI